MSDEEALEYDVKKLRSDDVKKLRSDWKKIVDWIGRIIVTNMTDMAVWIFAILIGLSVGAIGMSVVDGRFGFGVGRVYSHGLLLAWC